VETANAIKKKLKNQLGRARGGGKKKKRTGAAIASIKFSFERFSKSQDDAK